MGNASSLQQEDTKSIPLQERSYEDEQLVMESELVIDTIGDLMSEPNTGYEEAKAILNESEGELESELSEEDSGEEEELGEEEEANIFTPLNLNISSSFGNKADTSNEVYWLYSCKIFIENKDNLWFFMKNDYILYLEYKYLENNKNKFILNNQFEYDFDQMIQTRLDTGSKRHLIRITRLEMEELKTKYLDYLQHTNDKYYICEIKDKYYLYTPTIQDVLKNMESNLDTIYELEFRPDVFINLQTMQQVNKKTNKTRPIKYVSLYDVYDRLMDNIVLSFNY